MSLPITLVVPTYNRHQYLARLLDYYEQASFNIIIADSSSEKYTGAILNPLCKYLHFPGESITKKLSKAFNQVTTTYLVMCADDDFIVRDGIASCVQFLLANNDYSAAGGNIISYKRDRLTNEEIAFTGMYTNDLSYELSGDNPFSRLQQHFNHYRTIFYSVHKTTNLQQAFAVAAGKINNLFLNEYLTSVIPVVSGKYKDLPVLYQVREFSPVSGDKTTLNVDGLVTDPLYTTEYHEFIDCQAIVMASITHKDIDACKNTLNSVFNQFARDLPGIRNAVDNSIKKRMGRIMQNIPVIGNIVINYSRKKERIRRLETIVKTDQDKKNILEIKNKIIQYN